MFKLGNKSFYFYYFTRQNILGRFLNLIMKNSILFCQ